jgi:hypothetical protein
VNFDTIVVEHAQRLEFGMLAAGAVTEYLPADGFYRYAYVDGTSGADHYGIRPIDYDGEIPLTAGYYTYALNVYIDPQAGEIGSLSLQLLMDMPPR